jgi:hypothetical protein
VSLKKARESGRKIQHGAWVEVDKETFPELAGASFKVRGLNNKDYQRKYASLAFGKERDAAGMLKDADEAERMAVECIAETVLLDWKGVQEDEGQPDIPFSKEKAREYLNDPDLLLFRSAVSWCAQRVAQGTMETQETDTKN